MWLHTSTPGIYTHLICQSDRTGDGKACPVALKEFQSRTETAEQEPSTTRRPEPKTKHNGHTPQMQGKREEQQFTAAAVVGKTAQAAG